MSPKAIFKKSILLFSALMMLIISPFDANAVRIKDIAAFSGVRDNQLIGYGLVVGLQGTGDKKDSVFTMRSMVSMLEKMGVSIDVSTLKPKNVAAVMVTARMPVSSRPGTKIDVTVSSIGDATSLLGGVLLQAPLKGVDGKIYALAQGSLTVGGFTITGNMASYNKNITTTGIIPGGASIERGIPFEFNNQDKIEMSIFTPDFSTAQQIVSKVNDSLGGSFARAINGSTIELQVPRDFQGNLVPLMASIENIEVTPDMPAKVVVDEKTGTIVLGREVRISKVAVAHGSLEVMVQEELNVSQPNPFGNGQTVVTPATNVAGREEAHRLNMVEGATLQELVDGLNAIGATPRDVISILRTIHASGALHATMEVI